MKYITDPKEIYELELSKLQFCFSEIYKVGEEASELTKVSWRHVEILRHMNFILEEARMTGNVLIDLPH
jgi:hypothetical protein